MEKYAIEKLIHIPSDEKALLVKDRCPRFEWSPGIPILYYTRQEAPYIIDEDELGVEYGTINDDDNVKEEDEDEIVLNIIE